jgi:hypothetical protein
MKPPIWFSLILASQELSCLLFLIVIFLCKIYQSQNIVRCHSTGLVQSKLGTFSPDQRLSRPNPDPQGLPCLTCVQPNLTCPTHSPGIQSLDGDHLYEPVIPCDKVLWQKTEKVRNYSLKFDFFTFFLTILPVRAFVRPRQKVSRGHFVSILCSTAFCALNHGLNFVGNSAYTFQRERLTHNLQKYFSLFDKKVVRNYFWIDFYLSYCLSPYLSN